MGRSQTILSLVVGLMAVFVVFGPLIVSAPPPIPMRTQGRAFDRTGSPLPVGTPIRTFVDGVDYSNASSIADASGSYAVLTAGNSKSNGNASGSDTPTIQEGANLGDTIIYSSGDFTSSVAVFQEVFPWAPGAIVMLDLHQSSVASTPQPIKIQGLVTRPARGGNESAFLCNPTGVPVSLADYYLERDAPGTYHGGSLSLTGTLLPTPTVVQVNLTSVWLSPLGDALKLVYRNPGGGAASAGGADIVVDRLEFNGTSQGTLTWEPGNTIMADAPAPGIGRILARDASCTDTNGPSDFTLAIEPGLPANGPPTISIVVPAPNQEVQAATSVTFAWTMSDDVFLASYLHVWANVTIGNQTIPLVADQNGSMAVSWTTPDVAVSDAVLRVDVEDPFGAHASDTRTFRLTRQSPIALIVAVLIALVLIAFVVFGFLRARKHEQGPSPVPPTPPMAPIPPSTMPPPVGAAQVGGDKKVCPRCHTAVNLSDLACFFCGYRFSE